MYDWHVPVIVLSFIVLDLATGVAKGAASHNLDSKKMRDGLFHKMGFIMAMVLSYLCEYAMMYMELGFTVPIVNGVAIFICLTEIVSILENIKELNPKLDDYGFLKYFKTGRSKYNE